MDRSALTRIASKIAGDPPYEKTEVTAMPKKKEETLDINDYKNIEMEDGTFNIQKIVKSPGRFDAFVDGMFQGKPFRGVLVMYGEVVDDTPEWDGWDWKPGPGSSIGPSDEATDPIQRMMDVAGEAVEVALTPVG